MNADQLQLIRRSFAKLQSLGDAVPLLFYCRLFELEPSLRSMFQNDIQVQAHAFLAMLEVAVHGLDHPIAIAATLHRLGERHAGYGVQAQHYVLVKEALLWTFEQVLGEAFTPDVREAWASVYDEPAREMRAQEAV